MKEKKTDSICFRMSDDELNDLDMASYFADMTKSEFARRALHFYFNLRKYAPEVLKEMEKELEENDRS